MRILTAKDAEDAKDFNFIFLCVLRVLCGLVFLKAREE